MIYSRNIPAKTGESTALFSDGTPMHSKYRPHGELIAENPRAGFYVIGGIGGSFHLETLLSSLDESSFVIAVEADGESLEFSRGSGITQAVEKDRRIQFCTVDGLSFMLKKLYLPVLYPSFTLLLHRAWENHAGNAAERLRDTVQKALSDISADFSVQAHFGLQWQKNILQNLAQIRDCPSPTVSPGRTASVIAAGPSLDGTIGELRQDLEKTVVFCTDTAYQTLRKHSIEPDYVVSIDCQNLSLDHFTDLDYGRGGKKACVILELGSSPEIARLMEESGHRVYFTASSHPLSLMAAGEFGIPVIDSGSGTVAIAACDAARLSGAKSIRLYGADFSYSGAKPYARGTYLDSIYGRKSSRTSPAETAFCSLMYRTPLTECTPAFSKGLRNPRTSTVLQSYSDALLLWAQKNSFVHDGNSLKTSSAQNLFLPEQHQADAKKFIRNFSDEAGSLLKKSMEELKSDSCFYALLPFLAWQQNMLKDGKLTVFDHLKLANNAIKRYTVFYEE